MLAFCALFVSSCDIIGGSETHKEVEVKQIVELPDTVKQHLIKQDSLYSGLIAKIDTLTMELNTSQQKIAQLQGDLEKLEKPRSLWTYLTVAGILLALVALILHFLRESGIKKNEVIALFRNCLDESKRLKELQEKVENLGNSKKSSTNSRYMQTGSVSKKAEDRIAAIEARITEVIDVLKRHDNEIKSYSGTKAMSPSTPTNSKQPEFSKEGYAKLNSGAFFFEILESNQEGCVFHINFKSENRGEFDIISLDKIKSRNGWQDVVEATGDCTMADAKRYDVVSKGICVKTSDGYWEVKNNLKIKISR